jgi:hypothetical protein
MVRSVLSFFRGNRQSSSASHGLTPPDDEALEPVRAMHVPPTTDLAAEEQQLADDMRTLSAHLEHMTEIRAKIATARAPVERLTHALEEMRGAATTAAAALAQFDAHERERLEAWAQSGVGPRPVPSVQRRLELERVIEDANRSVANLEATLAAKKAALAPFEEELTALGTRRDALVVNVLLGRAEIIGHHYKAAAETLAQLGGELRGLNMCFAQMFSHVTLRRPDAPLYASVLHPPAICRGMKEPLFAEMRMVVDGFWLRAHNYRDIEAVAASDEITAAASSWQTYAMALMGIDAAGTYATADTLASLVADNAKLRDQLAGGSNHPKTTAGDDQ